MTMTESIQLSPRIALILSGHRAMLNNVTGNVAALRVNIKGSSFLFHVYYFDELTDGDLDCLHAISSEMIADFPQVMNEDFQSKHVSEMKRQSDDIALLIRAEAEDFLRR